MSSRQKMGLGIVMLWFVGGGIGHFVPASHAFVVSIVPPWLPARLPGPSALVYITALGDSDSVTLMSPCSDAKKLARLPACVAVVPHSTDFPVSAMTRFFVV